MMVIRADASAEIGTGHVLRALALAQGWQDEGGRVLMITKGGNPPLASRLSDEAVDVCFLPDDTSYDEDATRVSELAAGTDAAWIVLDGYDLDGTYQHRLQRSGVPILAVTDFLHTPRFHVNALLNQAPGVDEQAYLQAAPTAKLMLGLDYVLLRREFRLVDRALIQARRDGDVRRLVVTLGGGDAKNVTAKVIMALNSSSLEGIESTVLVGAHNPHRVAIERQLAGRTSSSITLRYDVADMPAVLASADLAICAAGATCWEMAYMGVPTLPIVLAENQATIASAVESLGCGHSLGWHDRVSSDDVAAALISMIADPGALAAMSRKGSVAVDGEGVRRVIRTLLTCVQGERARS